MPEVQARNLIHPTDQKKYIVGVPELRLPQLKGELRCRGSRAQSDSDSRDASDCQKISLLACLRRSRCVKGS